MGAFSFAAPSTHYLRFQPDEFAHHLRLRGSSYYFRQVIPRLGEITLSLRTGDRRTAKGLCHRISKSLSTRFAAVTTKPITSQQRLHEILEELREDARDTLRTFISENEMDDLDSLRWAKEVTQRRIQRTTGEPEDFIKLHAKLEFLEALEAKMNGNAMKLVTLAMHGATGALGEIAQQPSPKVLLASAEALQPAASSEPSDDYSDGSTAGHTFAQLVEQYTHEQKMKGKWSDKSELEAGAVVRILTALVPSGPVDGLTRKDFVRVSELLSNFPAQASKRFPHVADLRELALMNHAPDVLMSITTQNKHITRLSTILKWAELNGLIRKNLAEGLVKEKGGRASEEKSAFSNDDLRLIFRCIAEKRTPKPYKTNRNGGNPIQAFHYWVPVLGYYTGARVNEIASLRPQDVRQVDDVWCIDICQQNDGNKRTKTRAGDRIVPLHPELLRMGFVQFALKAAERECPRLFMELKMSPNGYGGTVSNWFNGHPDKSHSLYLRAGIRGANLSFHSLRHSFTTNMERARVDPITLKRLVGHAMDDMTYGRYSKGINPQIAFEELSKLPSLSDDILVPFEEWMPSMA
ncbi:site-specific integrase [Laribacter hongkongensis]|uniref:site-specific integrase n=1 Tax=Laribacter hongkongensis TaxID=168471 RepID=UPI001EFCCF30|nr:site-specific integrase [Laribacter hongkongensis]MCG9054235.1 site-specific integrase [Laribacter hongkongensis]